MEAVLGSIPTQLSFPASVICSLTVGTCPQYNAVNAWVPASFETPSMFPSWMKFGKKKKVPKEGEEEAKPQFRQVISGLG